MLYDRLELCLTVSRQLLYHHLMRLSCVTHILVDLNLIVIKPVLSCQLVSIIQNKIKYS